MWNILAINASIPWKISKLFGCVGVGRGWCAWALERREGLVRNSKGMREKSETVFPVKRAGGGSEAYIVEGLTLQICNVVGAN